MAFKSTASVRNVTRLKRIHFSLVSHVTMWCAVVQSDRLLPLRISLCLCMFWCVRASLFLVAISFITHRLFIVGCCGSVRLYHLFFHHSANHSNAKQLSDCEGTLAQMWLYLFILSPNTNTFLYLGLSTRIHSDLNYLNRVYGMWLFGCRSNHHHFDRRANVKKSHIERLTFRCINWLSNKIIQKHIDEHGNGANEGNHIYGTKLAHAHA